jgi:hypothetical protein
MPPPVPPSLPGPPDTPIQPRQVWMLLSAHQQHAVLEQIVTVCQHLLAQSDTQREVPDADR